MFENHKSLLVNITADEVFGGSDIQYNQTNITVFCMVTCEIVTL
jgi:hypothetical protein